MAQEPDLSAQDDGKLMAYIAARGTDAALAKAAWATLYDRHAELLKNACLQYGLRLPADYGVRDLVADTFIEAYANAPTYRLPQIAQRGLAPWTHRWLLRIATRLFIDKLRLSLGTHAAEERWSEGASKSQSAELGDAHISAARAQRLDRATRSLERLSPRDRELLMVSLDWFNTSSHRFEVPRLVIAELCRRHKIKPATYRQARDRAFDRVKEEFRQAGEMVA